MSLLPLVVIVGADKGGVGKTLVSRALLDYFNANAMPWRAFDTETPNGVLSSFFPSAEIVDLEKSASIMRVFDNPAPVTVIDISARLLSKTLQTLSEIGFLDPTKLRVVVLHVIGATTASFAEIAATKAVLGGASKYFLVKNRINNDSEFFAWKGETAQQTLESGDGLLAIPQLNALAMEHVEAAGVSFQTFIDTSSSLALRGFVRSWLAKVYEQLKIAKLDTGARSASGEVPT